MKQSLPHTACRSARPFFRRRFDLGFLPFFLIGMALQWSLWFVAGLLILLAGILRLPVTPFRYLGF